MTEVKKTIPELVSGTTVSGSLFESAYPNVSPSTGYSSVKVSSDDIATYIAAMHQFLALSTTAKNLIGAINELAQNSPIVHPPVTFRGTLGTDGTITTLPEPDSSNEGYMYLVITDGTYASQTAKVGDMFISDGSAWILIPSGNESESLVISQTLTAGQTSITFSNAAILATSFISVASEAWYTASTQTTGSVTLTFPAQSTDMLVQIMVAN